MELPYGFNIYIFLCKKNIFIFKKKGGWIADNIYYLGYANVINFGNIRIAGLSGIYKAADYNKGHFECPPFNTSTAHSAYHVRNLEIFRLSQIKKKIDIFIS